jgi:hypothetical protein
METKPDGIPNDIWASAMIEAAKYVEWAFQTRNVDADAEHVLATSISRMVLAERLKERELLNKARATNQRLNRRVQELERRIARDWHILDGAKMKPTAQDTVEGSQWSLSRAFLRVYKELATLKGAS